MHTENDFKTPRDRVSEALMRRAAANAAQTPFPVAQSRSWGLEGYPLGSVYAPLQNWQEIYDNETGFDRGTIFKELDLPFLSGDKGGN